MPIFFSLGPPGSGVGPNFHTSGNGFSYGAPSGGQFPSYEGANYPRPPTGGSSYGAGLGGTFGLAPSGQGGPGQGGPGLGGPGQGHGGPIQGHGFGHGGGGGDNHKAIALKSLIGVALLGAAAVLAKTHPVLLQLGVISGKKRRRRSVPLLPGIYPQNPFLKPAKRTKRIDYY